MHKSQRLIQLIMMINARKSFTVRELADELGLSARTITRDLRELGELGVPVYSVQGRGGGYRLLRERRLPPISFVESEAIALFIAGRSLAHFGALPFGTGSDAALHKLYHYLPADVQEQLDRLKDRVELWSPHRRMSADVLHTLLQAIMRRTVATIRYRSESGESERDIQPIGLYASSGYWYCPAYCLRRDELRQFRADRIVGAVLNESAPWREDVDRMTLKDKPDNRDAEQVVLHAELTSSAVWKLQSDNRFGPWIERREDGSGRMAVPVASSDLPFYVDLVWRLGAEARIVEPPAAVDAVRAKLADLQAQYR